MHIRTLRFGPKVSLDMSRCQRLRNWITIKRFTDLIGANVPDANCRKYLARTRKATLSSHVSIWFKVGQEITASTLVNGRWGLADITVWRDRRQTRSVIYISDCIGSLSRGGNAGSFPWCWM